MFDSFVNKDKYDKCKINILYPMICKLCPCLYTLFMSRPPQVQTSLARTFIFCHILWLFASILFAPYTFISHVQLFLLIFLLFLLTRQSFYVKLNSLLLLFLSHFFILTQLKPDFFFIFMTNIEAVFSCNS